jgi:hypothetical protein
MLQNGYLTSQLFFQQITTMLTEPLDQAIAVPHGIVKDPFRLLTAPHRPDS